MKIGAQIRAARRRLAMSQQDLAERVGVHYRTVQNIEAGKWDPMAGRLQRLSSAVGLSLADLESDDAA